MKAQRAANTILAAAIGYLGILIYIAYAKNVSTFYLVPLAVLAIGFGLSFRLSKYYKTRMALILASIAATVLPLEATLEIIDQPREQAEIKAAVARWQNSDGRSIPESVLHLRNSGIDVYPTVFTGSAGPDGFEVAGERIYPLAGISQTKTFFCNDAFTDVVVYESDEHGFHNPKGIWGQEQIDIVSVGDSFTHGACVKSELNATALIRSEYENTLNLGWAATGPYTHFAMIKEYAAELKPKVVLWFYFEGNDSGDLKSEPTKYPVLKRYLADPSYRQGLVNRQPEIDEFLSSFVDKNLEGIKERDFVALKQQKIVEAKGAPSFVEAISDVITLQNIGTRTNQTLHVIGTDEYDLTDQELDSFSRMLESSRDYIEGWGGQLYFVYLPTWNRYAKDSLPKNRVHAEVLSRSDKITSTVEGLGIPMIDATLAFDAHPDPLSLWPGRVDGHYNEAGYRLVADTVLESINLPK